MRKSLATPKQGGRQSFLGLGSVNKTTGKKQKVPEQKKLNFSANKSRSSTSAISTSKRWSTQGTSVKDTRPLSNRAFQKQMIEEIIEFLNESGYPHPISKKVLSGPTSKEFSRVFEHLYSCINSTYSIEKRVEEEVPRILKSLNYPFTISKSAMFAIGSLHTWPTLLGALHWMVELLKTINTIDIEQVLFPSTFQDEEFEKRHEKTFFEYTTETYKKYMLGEDDFTEYKEALKKDLILDAGCSEEDHEDLKKEVEDLEQELAALEAEPDPLDEAIKTKQNLEEKIEQHSIAIRECDQQLLIHNKQYLSLTKQVEEEGIDIGQLGDPNQQKEIKKKSAEVKARLERLNTERERMEKMNNEREINYSKLYENISVMINEYNDFVSELMLNPHIKNYLGENSIMLSFDHNLTDISSLNEVKNSVKSLLNMLTKQVAEDCHRLESKITSEQEKCQQITESLEDKSHELMQVNAKLEGVEKELQEKVLKQEQEFTGTLKNITAQEKILECELKQIQMALEEDKHALDLKKNKLKEETKVMRKEENELIEIVLSYVEEFKKYKDNVKRKMEAYNAALQAEIDHVTELEDSLDKFRPEQ